MVDNQKVDNNLLSPYTVETEEQAGGEHRQVVKVAAVPSVDTLDTKLAHAIEVIASDYGDTVSVSSKAKDLLKFGRNENVGSSTAATIMTLKGSETSETFVSTNAITHISSAAADTVEIVVEGHTISGTDLTFVSQTVTLQGTTKTALSTPMARATRAYNNGATNLTGPVYVYEDVAAPSGVPGTDSAVHLIIPAGKNQSVKASTSLSSQDYWIVTNFYADVLEKASAFVTVELQTRKVGKVFRERAILSASNSSRGLFTFDPYFIIPTNTDIRLQALSSGTNIDTSGGIQGYLAVVTS